MPSVAARSPRSWIFLPCFTRRISIAFSTSPSASVSAFLQSIMPAPVRSRRAFTSLAAISAVLMMRSPPLRLLAGLVPPRLAGRLVRLRLLDGRRARLGLAGGSAAAVLHGGVAAASACTASSPCGVAPSARRAASGRWLGVAWASGSAARRPPARRPPARALGLGRCSGGLGGRRRGAGAGAGALRGRGAGAARSRRRGPPGGGGARCGLAARPGLACRLFLGLALGLLLGLALGARLGLDAGLLLGFLARALLLGAEHARDPRRRPGRSPG